MSNKYLITGCNGQVGKALQEKYPQATAVSRDVFDICDLSQYDKIDWSKYDVIINAAAYVNADHSETPEGRVETWNANAIGPRNLAQVAIQHDIRLVHISSEYVFDGTKQNHNEDEHFSPLSVYGQSKAAGDIAASLVRKHYILRTSWVVGDGHNFVKTMKNLAEMRIDPKVVNDQFGRLTFVSELVRAIDYILTNNVKYGTYNLSNSGAIKSWAEIASDVFEIAGHDPHRVTHVSTSEYREDKKYFAPRPIHSDMNLSKIQQTGFKSEDYEPLLIKYIEELK